MKKSNFALRLQPSLMEETRKVAKAKALIIGRRATGVVKSAWIVRRSESAPRLISCFVK